MFTSLDKALVALVMAALYLLNNLFGVNIGVDEGLVNSIIVALTPVLVWFFPNKRV